MKLVPGLGSNHAQRRLPGQLFLQEFLQPPREDSGPRLPGQYQPHRKRRSFPLPRPVLALPGAYFTPDISRTVGLISNTITTAPPIPSAATVPNSVGSAIDS